MINQVLRVAIAALVLLPVCAQAGPIIQYQSVEARTRVDVSAFDRDPSVVGANDSLFLPLEPNPQDAFVTATLGTTASTVGVDYELDEANNSFSLDVSIAAVGNDLGNSGRGARADISIVLIVDFTVESDADDLVELVFSTDGAIPGLESLAMDSVQFSGSGAFVDLPGTSALPGSRFSLSRDNFVVSDTRSFLVQPGEPFRLLTVVEIENRALEQSNNLRNNNHLDAAGNLRLTSSFEVRSVPEPWSLSMLGFGLLVLGRRMTGS